MAELDKLLEDAPLPFIMQHAAKISAMRRRVSALNLILKSIQRRIDNMDRMLFAGVPTGIVCFLIYTSFGGASQLFIIIIIYSAD